LRSWYTSAYEMNQARKGEVRAGPLRVERHRMNRSRRVQSIHLALLSWICIVSRKRDSISFVRRMKKIAADLQWERTENRDIMIVCTKCELVQVGRMSKTMLY